MNTKLNDFEKFAVSNGIGTSTLDRFNKSNLKSYGRVSPIILEEREMNVIGLDIFSRLMYDRVLFLGTVVDEDSANIINSQLMYLNSTGSEDVKLFLNTPGGSVIDGLSIYDVMNYITPDVATYCMGMCASMGSVLLSSGAKGKRFSLPNGEIMMHQLGSKVEGKFADMEIAIKHASRLQDKLFRILAENTGKTPEEIKRDADRDNWLTAEGALEYGLIDQVIKTSKQ